VIEVVMAVMKKAPASVSPLLIGLLVVVAIVLVYFLAK
jgi:hypothetical protein